MISAALQSLLLMHSTQLLEQELFAIASRGGGPECCSSGRRKYCKHPLALS